MIFRSLEDLQEDKREHEAQARRAYERSEALERIRFFAAVDRLISEELACPLCAEKRREYRALPPRRRPPARAPCYIHTYARRALYAGAR